MNFNKDNFTIHDLKQLLKEAFNFDYGNHNDEVEFYQFTIVEWHKSDAFKNRLSLNNIKENISIRYKPLKHRGIYNSKESNIGIFFQRNDIFQLLKFANLSLDELIVYYIKAVFHELKHHYQQNLSENVKSNRHISFNLFAYNVSRFTQHFNNQHYKNNHNKYWYEIDADSYGIDRAEEFLLNKGLLTKERKQILENLKNKCLFRYNNYDLHFFLHELHNIVKSNFEIIIRDFWYVDLFYKWNGNFKSIDEISDLAKEWNVDKQILDYFFSSKDFLESLNFNLLSLENKQVILNAMECALEIELNRHKKNKEFLQNKHITAHKYLEDDKRICRKIVYLNKRIEELRKGIELIIDDNQEKFKSKG